MSVNQNSLFNTQSCA